MTTSQQRAIRSKDIVRLLETAAADYGSHDVDRQVLANALAAGGLHDLAGRLRRYPPDQRFGGSQLEADVRNAIFKRRPHAQRRGGKPSAYAVRTDDLARLFYDTNKNEMELAPSRAGDIATREVLADALEERGLTKLAMELRRFNRLRRSEPLGPLSYDSDRKFGPSLLRQKIQRAIFGPRKRASYDTRKPVNVVLLADLGSRSRGGRGGGVREVDRWFIDSDYGDNYVIEVSDGGYGSLTFLVRANDESSAIEIAEEQWPDWFFDEVDEPDEDDDNSHAQPHPTKEGVWVRPTEDPMYIYRPRWVARGRVLDARWSGGSGTAYVPGRGTVEFRG